MAKGIEALSAKIHFKFCCSNSDASSSNSYSGCAKKTMENHKRNEFIIVLHSHVSACACIARDYGKMGGF